MKSKYWCYLFFADLLLQLLSILFGWNESRAVTKILLTVLLFAWLVASSSKFLPLHYYIGAALFFSSLGDIFLLIETNAAIWFMAGLGSFLLAHVMYILFFLKLRRSQVAQKPWSLFIIAAVVIYAASLFIFLYPYIGSLKLPVGIYALTIAMMLITATHAFNNSKKDAAVYCITGAVLFILSDSLLALNKFYKPFSLAGLAIMLTYGLAQFAIVKGALLYLKRINLYD